MKKEMKGCFFIGGMLLCGGAVSWVLSIYIPNPFLIMLGIVMIAFELLIMTKWTKSRTVGCVVPLAAAGIIIRSAAGLVLVLSFHYNYPSTKRFLGIPFLGSQILSFVFMPETSNLERSVYVRAFAIRGGPEEDLFSHGALREHDDGRTYSIGPDLVDQELSIIYDPTNGTISPGDIPVDSAQYHPGAAQGENPFGE